MNLRSLLLTVSIIFICFASTIQIFCGYYVISGGPHGSISAWKPGSYGSSPFICNNKPPLPTWVWITFDKDVSDDFVRGYGSLLKLSNKLLNIHGVPKKINVKNTYVIVVDHSITQAQCQLELEKANRICDPEIERQEKFNKEKEEQSRRARALAREEAHKAKITEELRLQKEAEAVRLQREAEQRAMVIEATRLAKEAEAMRLRKEEIRLKQEVEKAKRIAAMAPKQALLKNAIIKDSASGVISAIKGGADVNLEIEDKTPLWYAVIRKKSNAIEALLDSGASLHDGQSLLAYAIKICDTKSAVLLMKNGASLCDINYTVLQSAMGFLQKPTKEVTRLMVLELLTELLNHDFHLTDDNTWILEPLWRTAINESEQALKLILGKGANPDVIWRGIGSSPLPTTPLVVAVGKSKIRAVKILLDAGVSTSRQNFYWDTHKEYIGTPLKIALDLGFTDIADLLIEYGATL